MTVPLQDGHTRQWLLLSWLWVGVITGVIFAAMLKLFADEFSRAIWFQIVMILLVLPTAASFFFLYLSLIKDLKFWLLLLVPLIYVPKVFIVMCAVSPLIYLSYMTWRAWRSSGDGESAASRYK